jgi:hypothetical protein
MNLLIPALVLVHSWYPMQCCGNHDCHPVPCSEIRHVLGGWEWWKDGKKVFFQEKEKQPSQDDQCHVCVNGNTTDGEGNPFGLCIFMLPGGDA